MHTHTHTHTYTHTQVSSASLRAERVGGRVGAERGRGLKEGAKIFVDDPVWDSYEAGRVLKCDDSTCQVYRICFLI